MVMLWRFRDAWRAFRGLPPAYWDFTRQNWPPLPKPWPPPPEDE